MSKSEDTGSAVRKRSERTVSAAEEARRHTIGTRLAAAIRKRDPKKVRDLAWEAGAGAWAEAVLPLCDFLAIPASQRRPPRSRKRAWSEARIAAVNALSDIGSPSAYRTLVRTLACDPDPTVREFAAVAVRRVECEATFHLTEVVRDPIDWDLDGMCTVLACLSEPDNQSHADRRSAGIVLTDVMFENVPLPPARWTRPARKASKLVGFAVLAVVGYQSLPLLEEQFVLFLIALFGAWMASKSAQFATYLIGSVICNAAESRAERRPLAVAAASSLVRLNDRRAIPGMLQLAFGVPLNHSGRQAQRVLKTLLPQLTEHDAHLFSPLHIEILNGAVARLHDAELTIALLHGLRAVGDRTSIRRVERLAKRGRTDEIRRRAAETLSVLEAREARIKISQSLLRGSAAPTVAPGEMLRAAMPQSTNQPEHLLRAVQNEQR